ncbi:hypothetical protein [Streptomyces clavuligerus]|uniref:hypothetical protein n=1 Tax=Streptomyces clavuligerus TaxID=1901 RepID=UPI00018000C4|nr:hypothetical protein [Streptomyces clavuligerus]ANW19540.1 hypothetical protein BB341_15600 [Streptomyces clavuligerus]AXU14146.1 hypothetical protein D1794_16260 [Streptomyces clavuligerus]EDY51217.1 hypothetical protein SSCG_04301 [Streptomyces clavuligerus]MBY6304139.1 hypothetical protein [Streptomyces clavuligerus]QCS06919.1 hypothetical protein CRV15_15615 [Streptomyces clavuligerus]
MSDDSPAIEPLLARLCGGTISGKDYVGYFMNEHGEELVFAQRRGDKTAGLWHSDTDWEMVRVGDHSIRLGGDLEGMITVADLIINRSEATWLSSCLAASRHLRPGRT